jgi:hypothetical protein
VSKKDERRRRYLNQRQRRLTNNKEINIHYTIIDNKITTTTTLIYNQIIGIVTTLPVLYIQASCNVMAHAQKLDFFFRRNGRVHLNRQGRQFSRLMAAEACASAVVMLDTSCSEVVWRVLAAHSIRQFPLQYPSLASPCATTFQLEATTNTNCSRKNHQYSQGTSTTHNGYVTGT